MGDCAESNIKALLAGESFITTGSHTKGFDYATLGRYEEVGASFVKTLEDLGMGVKWCPNHLAQLYFPETVEELKEYDVVILSDITSNTLLLHPNMMFKWQPRGNRLEAIKEYVLQGSGLLMIGGYMSYCGRYGKGRAVATAFDALPHWALPEVLEWKCYNRLWKNIIEWAAGTIG